MSLTQNFFELFDIPVAFDIDSSLVAERYRKLQQALHPDRFANASDSERRLSVQRTAQVNEAFQTLKSPLLRARYLLQLKGIVFDDEKETTMDPVFLMEQIEMREAIAEVKQSADPLAKVTAILSDIKQRDKEMQAQLAELFHQADEQALTAAKQTVQKMQFFRRLQQEAEAIEEELVDML